MKELMQPGEPERRYLAEAYINPMDTHAEPL
jgi:hypothetical protein